MFNKCSSYILSPVQASSILKHNMLLTYIHLYFSLFLWAYFSVSIFLKFPIHLALWNLILPVQFTEIALKDDDLHVAKFHEPVIIKHFEACALSYKNDHVYPDMKTFHNIFKGLTDISIDPQFKSTTVNRTESSLESSVSFNTLLSPMDAWGQREGDNLLLFLEHLFLARCCVGYTQR